MLLPFDIVDLFIDELRDSLDDLRSCALVCRSWLPRARFHLFRSISLAFPYQCGLLRDAIVDSPFLATLIRDISFQQDVTLAFFSLVIAESEIHFPYLQSVRLQNISFGQWVSDEVISAPIISILSLPSVTHIGFESCAFQDAQQLNRLLNCCASGVERRFLTIQLQISFADRTMALGNNSSIPDVQIDVRSLDLMQQTEIQVVDWLAHPKCALGLLRLEELSVKYSLLNSLLPAVVLPSLQHLVVFHDKVSEPVGLLRVRLPSLTHVTVKGLRNHSTSQLRPLLSAIYPTGHLEDSPLERVTLEVSPAEHRDTNLSLVHRDPVEQEMLLDHDSKLDFDWDVTLASVQSLQRVDVIYFRHGLQNQPCVMPRKVFENRFPALLAKGLLRVEIVIDPMVTS